MGISKRIGPASVVTAAFIGPGTVTLCSIAGAKFDYSLLWALLFSVLATVSLQEMTARLGIISGQGLGTIIRKELNNPLARIFSIILVLGAIVIGNLAYEAGNITGGMLGLELFFTESQLAIHGLTINYLSVLIGIICFVILFFGNYKTLEKILFLSVIVMSFAFVITALLTKPSFDQIIPGLFIPKISSDNILTIVSLIGTTIVPYNLFLHSALVAKKWNNAAYLSHSKMDTIISVGIGGIISMSIIICAANMNNSEINGAVDLARTIVPVFGDLSNYLIGFGLTAAGLSSAITAPLAAAIVAKECLAWKDDAKSIRFRFVWMSILIPGFIFSSIGFKPIEVIKFAQIINGILLPVAAGFLLLFINKKSVMSVHVNTKVQNAFGIIIFVVTIILGMRSIFKVLSII